MSCNCIQCLCEVLPSLLLFSLFLKANNRHSWRIPSKWQGAQACAWPVCRWQGTVPVLFGGKPAFFLCPHPPHHYFECILPRQRVFDPPWLSKWVLISTLAKETEDVALIMSLSASGWSGGCGHFCMWLQGRCHQMSPAMPLSCWAAFLELPLKE